MKMNVRVFAKHVRSENNSASDSLSRLDFNRFRQVMKHKAMELHSTVVPAQLLPISRIWVKN